MVQQIAVSDSEEQDLVSSIVNPDAMLMRRSAGRVQHDPRAGTTPAALAAAAALANLSFDHPLPPPPSPGQPSQPLPANSRRPVPAVPTVVIPAVSVAVAGE